MEGVQAAMTTRNLEPAQWRNREEWRLVSGRRRQLLKNRADRYIDRYLMMAFEAETCCVCKQYNIELNKFVLIDGLHKIFLDK